MRQKALDIFYHNLRKYDLAKLNIADFGGQKQVVLIKNGQKRSIKTPFINMFKSYTTFNIKNKADILSDLTKPLSLEEHNKYDLVISFDTLEHVNQPFEFCKNMVLATKPSGLIYVSTVFAWRYHSSKDYFRFSPDGLKACFEESSVNIIDFGWDTDSTYIKNETGVFLFCNKK